jgi:hypothetical protein
MSADHGDFETSQLSPSFHGFAEFNIFTCEKLLIESAKITKSVRATKNKTAAGPL